MHTLDTLTATQLTAGSTLNRPAAVIRELIDNAIDAQATAITLILDQHGRMRLQDNGIGITATELPHAFARHTTSKLTHYADLCTLTTLGFRGEALAAIAAIARVTCISRTATCTTAHELRIAGGEIHDIRPCAGTIGTDITVEHLYQMIPQRRHFWRQPHTERQHIIDICIQYALIYSAIAFRVIIDQTTHLVTSGTGNMHHALMEIWPHITPTPVVASTHDGTAHINGFVASDYAPARRQQIIAINRRPIAVRGVYAHLLDELLPPMRHQHATAILDITLPPDSIDINVRSTKDEIGIRTPSVIAKLLYASICTPTPPTSLPQIHLSHMPTLTHLGRYADWHLWICAEGVVIMNPANVIKACQITQFATGDLCVPPHPLSPQMTAFFVAHATQWEQCGLQLAYNHAQQLCIIRTPFATDATAITRALDACVRTVNQGGSFIMGIGHLLTPQWLYTQLLMQPNPWVHRAVWMIGHYRIADALRVTHVPTGVPDQSP